MRAWWCFNGVLVEFLKKMVEEEGDEGCGYEGLFGVDAKVSKGYGVSLCGYFYRQKANLVSINHGISLSLI